MKNKLVTTLSVVSILSLAGCALTEDDKAATEAEKVVEQVRTPSGGAVAQGRALTMTAQIHAVDLKERQVTLQDKDGETFIIDVPPEVRRLSEINVGDLIELRFRRAVALGLVETEGNVNVTRTTAGIERAGKDQPPAGVLRETVTALGTVAWVDKKAREVTLRGAGRTVTLEVSEGINLDNIDVGDRVLATYVQELAISIEPASSEKAREWNI